MQPNSSLQPTSPAHTHTKPAFIPSAPQQVFGCQSINIDSHFDTTYSFIYLLIHSLIHFSPKKNQLLWMRSGNGLTYEHYLFRRLDRKIRAKLIFLVELLLCIFTAIKRRPTSSIYCCIDILQTKMSMLDFPEYHFTTIELQSFKERHSCTRASLVRASPWRIAVYGW